MVQEITWDTFLDRLDGGSRILHRWLGSLIRTPTERRPYLFLYSPEQDTGKSSFYEAAGAFAQVVYAKQALCGSGFNGVLNADRPLCVIEDLPLFNELRWRKIIQERLSEWVDAPKIQIHRQAMQPQTRWNTTSWVQCGHQLGECLVPNFLAIRVPPLIDRIPKLTLLEALKVDAPRFIESLGGPPAPPEPAEYGVADPVDTHQWYRGKCDRCNKSVVEVRRDSVPCLDHCLRCYHPVKGDFFGTTCLNCGLSDIGML